VILLFFFMMILLPESLGKKLQGRRNCLHLPSLNTKLWQTVGQTKVTQDKMPLQPSVVELNIQHLIFVLKSGIKPSEGSFQGGCYGFAWQGFCSGGAIGVASVRRCEKLPLRLIKPVPGGSKTDLPLDW